MPYYGPDRSDATSGLAWFAYVAVFLILSVVLVLGANAIGLVALPFFYHQQSQAQRASPQFIDSHVDLLLRLEHDAEDPDATDAQRRATVIRMRDEAAKLPPEDVPGEVRRYLAAHQ